MITEKEQKATLLSATKKDYYQIWMELVETAGKISDRWSVEGTNESDPGIVLLKVLTAIADKLNYNVDKNILEAFMPSAAQEESMRKLCDMMGYAMKYYRSANTDITVSYIGDSSAWCSEEYADALKTLVLPMFTQFTNVDGDVIYTTTETGTFTNVQSTITVPSIEGTLQVCEEDNNGVVTLNLIDDNFRYYFSSTVVAENGVFIYDIDSNGNMTSSKWTQVNNLNSVALNNKYYKFGFDSKKALPYIQFPEDVGTVMGEGVRILYIATNGVNGNIKARVISTFTTPELWTIPDGSTETTLNRTGNSHTADEFSCTNANAATNGADKELLNDAYKNFKKTIGTFDTLVTCRDYMNKIYQLTVSETNTTPLVSNSIVSDIRDDINKAVTICTFGDYGIKFVDRALPTEKQVTGKDSSGDTHTITITEPKITNFDLTLYPFTTVKGLNTKAEYINSFKVDKEVTDAVIAGISDYKTISHNIMLPDDTEIACIKNYLKLNAKITTTAKVNTAEWASILENIKTAIYTYFNLRQLDFSEELPFDDILTVIENADINIKNVSLDDPALYTAVLTADNREYFFVSDDDFDDGETGHNKLIIRKFTETEKSEYKSAGEKGRPTYLANKKAKAKKLYNQLALRNILAGRVEMFNYESSFTANVNETQKNGQAVIIPTQESDKIYYLEPEFKVYNQDGATTKKEITVAENEIIQFSAPNLRTTITYPAYVNYFAKLNSSVAIEATPASFQSLYLYLNNNDRYLTFMKDKVAKESATEITTIAEFNSKKELYGTLFKWNNNTWEVYTGDPEPEKEGSTKLKVPAYYYPVGSISYGVYFNWVHEQTENGVQLSGLYKAHETNLSYIPGKLIDNSYIKYVLASTFNNYTTPLQNLYVQMPKSVVDDGLGKDAILSGIPINGEYQLQPGESLKINYTNSTSTTGEITESSTAATIETTSTVVEKEYGPGDIIRVNFELKDSAEVRKTGKSYPKTSGYSWSTDEVPGMYNLGTNEQIEIREFVTTYVYDDTNTDAPGDANALVYVYYKLNNETDETVFLNAPETSGDKTTYDSRVLDEGEYFYYTDRNKQTFTYCGAGSIITNFTDKQIKKAKLDEITSEDILTTGIAIIPWINISGTYMTEASKKAGKPKPGIDKYISWTERQYINLASGDTLKAIDNDSIAKTTISLELDKTEKDCSNATYRLLGSSDDETLPKFNLKDSQGNPVKWKVRTKLAINAGPSYAQKLIKDSKNSFTYSEELLSVLKKDKTKLINNITDISFKTNYLVNSNSDRIETTFIISDELGLTEETVDNFQIKFFEEKVIEKTEGDGSKETINLNNSGKGYTSVNFDKYFNAAGEFQNKAFITLYYTQYKTVDKQFGLISFYYLPADSTADKTTFVRLKTTNGNLKIYNQNDWWASYTESEYYILKPGLNVVEIALDSNRTLNTNIEIWGSGKQQNTSDLVMWGGIDLINMSDGDKGINLDLLKYFNTTDTEQTKTKRADQLLKDIKAIDANNEFLYNALVDSSLQLNINTSAEPAETLATNAIWYDYNNINNKFVISEIDADYLDSGITLARTSIK